MSEAKETGLDKTNIVAVKTNGIGDSQEPTIENEKSREAIWSHGNSWDDICTRGLVPSIVEIVQTCTPLPQRSGGRKMVSVVQSGEPSKASSIPIMSPKRTIHKINKSEIKSEPGSPARIPKYVKSKIPIISPERFASNSSEATPVKTRSSSVGAIPKNTPYSTTKTVPKKTSYSAVDTTLKKSSTLFNSNPKKNNDTCNGAIQEVHSSVNGTIPKKTGAIPKDYRIVPKEIGSIPMEIGTTPKKTGAIPKDYRIVPKEIGSIPMEIGTTPKNTGTIPKEKKICGTPDGSIQKVHSSVTEDSSKKAEIVPKNTGTIPKGKKICGILNEALHKKVHCSVIVDAPKKTGTIPRKTGTIPKKTSSTAAETTLRETFCDMKANDMPPLSTTGGYFPSDVRKEQRVVEETKKTIHPTEQLQSSESTSCRQSNTEDSSKLFCQEIYVSSSNIQESVPLSKLDKIEEKLDDSETSKVDVVVSGVSDDYVNLDATLSSAPIGEETYTRQKEEHKEITSQRSDLRSISSGHCDSTLSSETMREETNIGQIEEDKNTSQLNDARNMPSGQWSSTLSSETMVEEIHIAQKDQTSSKENNMLKLRTKPKNPNDPPIILKPKKSSFRKWFRSKLPKPTPEFRQLVEAQTDVEDVIRLVDLTVEELLKINAPPEYGKIEGLKRNVRFTQIMESYNTKYALSDIQDSDFGTMETETVISETRTEADSGQDTMDTCSEMKDDNPDDWEDLEDAKNGVEWEVVKTTGLSKQKLRDICSYIHLAADKDVDNTASLTIETCPQEDSQDQNLADNFEELAIKDKHLPRNQKYDKLNKTIIERTSTDQQILDGQNLKQQLHGRIDKDDQQKFVTYQKPSTSKGAQSRASYYQRPLASKMTQSRLVSEHPKPSGSKTKLSKFAAKYKKSSTSKVEQSRPVTDYKKPSTSRLATEYQKKPSTSEFEQPKFIPYSDIPYTSTVDQQNVDFQVPSTSKLQEDMISVTTTVREEIPSVPLKTKRKVSFDTAVLKIDAPVFKPLMFPYSNESPASTSSANSVRPESSQTSSTSSLQSWSTGEYPQIYSITSEDKLRKMKEIIALSAFKSNEPWSLTNIRPDLIREKTSRAAELKELKERKKEVDVRDGTTETFQIEGQNITINTPPAHKVHAHNPESRNIVETIDRIEDFLELVLTLGFKISRSMIDKFEPQKVPTPIHNAMCDVRSFTSPIKQQLKIALEFGDGVFFKPLADSVNSTINPAFNHLNDSIIALESPATLNFIPLKSEPVRRAINLWDQNPFNTLLNLEAQAQPHSDFLTQTMNQFFKMNRYRMMSPMERGRINPNGIVEIPFQHDIQVGVTIDLGLMLMSKENHVLIALSADEVLAGMRFRYGEMFQKNELIEFSCFNGFNEVMKRARFNDKGVSFQDEMSPLTYLITPAGIATCQPIISCIVPESITNIFYSGSRVGEQFTPECVELLQFSRFEFHQDDSMNWIIKNVKIKQTTDGQVVIHKKNATYTLVITPRIHEDNEFAVSSRLTTPTIHVTSSAHIRDKGNKFHMYARQQGKKIFYSEQKFVCRNNTQSAGIDANHSIYLDAN